jgi:anion-transporting  ArsA/GET3 family ATPase
VLVVLGKGGTGRTTVCAALAEVACSQGMNALVISVDGRPGLGARLGGPEPVGYAPVVLRTEGQGKIEGRTISPDAALAEWLETHGLGRIGRRMAGTGTLELVATAIPGIRDVLVLGKVRSIELSQQYDLIIVDAPASGHARTFLGSASGVLDTAASGAVHRQAQGVVDMVHDQARCATVVVSLPEETPVNETVETLSFLAKNNIAVNAVAMNMVVPLDDVVTTPSAVAAKAAQVELSVEAVSQLDTALGNQRHTAENHQILLERLTTEGSCTPIVLPYQWDHTGSLDDTVEIAAALSRQLSEIE